MLNETVKLTLDVQYGISATDTKSPRIEEMSFGDFDIVDSGYMVWDSSTKCKIPVRQYASNIPILIALQNTDDADTFRINFVDSVGASVILAVKPGELCILPNPAPVSGQLFIGISDDATGTGTVKYFVFGAKPA